MIQKEFRTSVIVRHGKAYVSTDAKVENFGIAVIIEPMYVVDMNVQEIAGALNKVYEAGNPKLPPMSVEEVRNLPDITLNATKVKNWKKLREGAACYFLKWENDGVTFAPSNPKLDYFTSDPSKTRCFPVNTSMGVIAQAILDDVATRPEVINYKPDPIPSKKNRLSIKRSRLT
jgi:hypothetical protein